MKQRFSSLDVKIIAHELSSSLCSLRLSNIYDLSSRIFLLKFAKPDHRQQLVIDSGFRCHLTNFSRTTAAAPSAFVTRLRKFLRTRRVTSVAQIGTDRVIEIQFSDGQYRLFLEFYAGGNIILTDAELNIISVLRIVGAGADQEEIRIGLKYNLSYRQNFNGVPPLTKERVREALQAAVNKEQAESKQKKNKKSGDVLRKALATSITEFPPMLIEHALKVVDFDPKIRPEEVLQHDALFEKLMLVLEEADKTVKEITSSEVVKGYILAKPRAKSSKEDPEKGAASEAKDESHNLLYEDFHPFRPRQFVSEDAAQILEFEGFNKTVDAYFSSIESQKLETRLQERELHAERKLDSAREEQRKRLEGLQQVQELNIRKAQAIEANLERVEEACAAVNSLIAQGMDWVEINRLVEMEQRRNNPVAEIIKLPLKLHENTATLLLGEMDLEDVDIEEDETDSELSDSEEEEITSGKPKAKPEDKRLAVDLDLGLSPWSNARIYYDQKKGAAVKEQKTMQASTKALKSTEKKVAADLKKGLQQEKQVLRPVRKQLWFEKFLFFISSDGYLILGGKDAQQNEMLYRRYLKKGDIYVHAELQGAASVIVKNNPSTPDAPIPPSTLSQAGNLSVATSVAWDSKAVMSAWWVNYDQVSKSAPTGEYLGTGSFMIRGKKNFLPPAQLLLGFAVMFQISEESKARHVKHRLRDEDSIVADRASNAIADLKVTDDADGSVSATPAPEEGAAAATTDSEDEDFPDAKLESDVDNDDAQSSHPNPLQSEPQAGQDLSRSESSKGQTEDGPKKQIPSELPQDDGDSDEEEDESDAATQPTEKPSGGNNLRDLSARERRLARKGQLSDTEDFDGDSGISTPTSKPKSAPQVRGKRGKKKKIAAKYADQDEEDRELALKLLGSASAKSKAEEAARQKKAKEEELAFQLQRRREQHTRQQQKAREHEEMRQIMMQEEGTTIETLDEEEAAQMRDLDAFVGTPLAGDEIIEAIPICAPWTALAKYKYRAKLQPGSTKKGKAVKEILFKWAADGADRKNVDDKSEDKEKIWPRELELIKAWKDTEVVNTLPVRQVRVMMAGGSAGGGGDKGKGGKGGGGGGKGKGGKGGKKR
ncbi:hypothetical protein L228DRAFT_221227 [Xylona heveae TC161]|uniref:Ribosome quality control complex subunit 2 n=1 Tax=Xylona heveae (strain CBS 132557 / TC161) TaxID=1328760 RepID=A0A165GLZ6_XYLHT|nr:hypothetical protein L228DRAFT_221227 [Xylona heveae TC161]KZF22356.1 hypothetical protein L228DRAFT_221227 [Xylona heveae TC161]